MGTAPFFTDVRDMFLTNGSVLEKLQICWGVRQVDFLSDDGTIEALGELLVSFNGHKHLVVQSYVEDSYLLLAAPPRGPSLKWM